MQGTQVLYKGREDSTPQDSWTRVPPLRNPSAAPAEVCAPRACGPQREKHRGEAHGQPRSLQREKPVQQHWPSTAKNESIVT